MMLCMCTLVYRVGAVACGRQLMRWLDGTCAPGVVSRGCVCRYVVDFRRKHVGPCGVVGSQDPILSTDVGGMVCEGLYSTNPDSAWLLYFALHSFSGCGKRLHL